MCCDEQRIVDWLRFPFLFLFCSPCQWFPCVCFCFDLIRAPCVPFVPHQSSYFFGSYHLRYGVVRIAKHSLVDFFRFRVCLQTNQVNESYYNDREKEEDENNNGEGVPYEVERIATILAVTFIFLSALYTIFAVLLFLCHAGEEQSILRVEQGTGGGVGIGTHMGNAPGRTKTTPLVGKIVDRGRRGGVGGVVGQLGQTSTLGDGARGFITMDNSSQGTSE